MVAHRTLTPFVRGFESFTRCQIGIHCAAMDTDFFFAAAMDSAATT